MMHTIFYFFADQAVNLDALPHHRSASGSDIQHILQIVFAVAGALALLMVTISGFRYVISSGEPQATAKAKDGILYALIGLIVCVLAEAIVSFVLGSVG